MGKKRGIAVVVLISVILLSTLPLVLLRQPAQPEITLDKNDVCLLGQQCYPTPLVVQVVSSYDIRIPTPPSNQIRIAVKAESGALNVLWLGINGGLGVWSTSSGGTVDQIIAVSRFNNYTLSIQNTASGPSRVEISIWYVK